MTLNILSIWQKNRPELDQALEAGEVAANTTAATLGLAAALGVANPVVGVAAAGLAFASPVKKGIEAIAKKSKQSI